MLLVDTDPHGGLGLSLSKSAKTREGFQKFLVRNDDLRLATLSQLSGTAHIMDLRLTS